MILDPDSSLRDFCQAGGRRRSLDGRQNRYSYVTTSAAVRFGGEIMGLKPPWSQLGILRWYPPCSTEVASEPKVYKAA
jgi:hypothetical protein